MPPIGQPNPQFQGYEQFGQDTPKTVLIAITSTVVLEANPDRVFARLINNSDRTIWVMESNPAVVGEGTRLLRGSALPYVDNELYLGQINAIAVGGPANIDVTEGVL